MPPKKKGGKKKKKKGSKDAKGPVTPAISGTEALPPVVPNPKTQAMMFTVATSNMKSLSTMVAHFDYRDVLHTRDANGSTGLHVATRKGDPKMLQHLLGYPEIRNSQIVNAKELNVVGGYSALHHACIGGNKICVKLLIDAGADVNIHADSALGDTPLHVCCKGGHIECAKLLCSSGRIDMDARDAMGHNASFWAYSKRYEDMIRILNLPPVHSCTADEYLAIMMKRNHNAFTLPSLKKAKKKGTKKKK